MRTRSAIAIEVGRHRLRALHGVRGRGALAIRRAIVSDLPEQIARDDHRALGEWIGDQLRTAGFPRGRATVALAREDVGLKRLTLPTTDPNELPDMTRLALQRDLPFDADAAIIDYVPLERGETSTTVLAVAAPDSVCHAAREMIRAAGFEVERIALRAAGSAALLRAAMRGADCALAVDISGDAVEFCVVENGSIRFSRAAELTSAHTPIAHADGDPLSDLAEEHRAEPDERDAAIAEAVVTETRRTWMSYRIVEGATEVRHAVVMGERRVADLAARAIGEMLGADASVLAEHPNIAPNGDSLDRVWPLAGLLLESELGIETIDFASPRRPVDLAARHRRWAIMAAGLLIVALLAAWTIGSRNLQKLDEEHASVRKELNGFAERYARYQRDSAKLTHLKRWDDLDVGWIDHLTYLTGLLPEQTEIVLDGWSGTLDFKGVRFDKKTKDWASPKSLAIVVDGEAKDRATADALRAALVATEWYVTSSSGTDAPGGKRLPFGFTYRLRTTRTTLIDNTERVDEMIDEPPAGEVAKR